MTRFRGEEGYRFYQQGLDYIDRKTENYRMRCCSGPRSTRCGRFKKPEK